MRNAKLGADVGLLRALSAEAHVCRVDASALEEAVMGKPVEGSRPHLRAALRHDPDAAAKVFYYRGQRLEHSRVRRCSQRVFRAAADERGIGGRFVPWADQDAPDVDSEFHERFSLHAAMMARTDYSRELAYPDSL